jgi:glucose-1-phosphate cytidylyltransferase
MKAVILAGGKGTRLMEMTGTLPKPLVEIGGKPVLWHIMKNYAAHGIHEFIICLGYKGNMIKEYFSNYFLYNSDVTFNIGQNQMEVHEKHAEPWIVRLIDTGENTQTGGRLRRVAHYLEDTAGQQDFCFTYGDGVGDVDIAATVAFHKAHGKKATVTATKPPTRFGAIVTEGDKVVRFEEKPVSGADTWVSGGFFVLNRQVIDLIEGDDTIWERGPMEKLAADGQMMVWRHKGFWHPMDTLRDKTHLESLWESGNPPWKKW